MNDSPIAIPAISCEDALPAPGDLFPFLPARRGRDRIQAASLFNLIALNESNRRSGSGGALH